MKDLRRPKKRVTSGKTSSSAAARPICVWRPGQPCQATPRKGRLTIYQLQPVGILHAGTHGGRSRNKRRHGTQSSPSMSAAALAASSRWTAPSSALHSLHEAFQTCKDRLHKRRRFHRHKTPYPHALLGTNRRFKRRYVPCP